MKQSTKLLSVVLAVLVAFSCFSVIGSAALAKGDIKYDGIDDAALKMRNAKLGMRNEAVAKVANGKLQVANFGTALQF